MQIRSLKVFSLFCTALLYSCTGNQDEGIVNHQQAYSTDNDKMLRANRYLNMRDQVVVEGYIERHGLKMKQSDFGFYYRCVEKGHSSRRIGTGDQVLYSYRMQLIDGTPIDSSGTELAQITIDKSDGIAGLHEGLKYFQEGDSIQLILTPNLAYGLVGDGEKVPSRATLVYSIRIKSVQ